MNVQIRSDAGRIAEVSSFAPNCESTRQVLVAIRCDDERTGETCMLIVRDALSVPAMDYNLIPSFIMRKVGVNVRTVLKFQVEAPSNDDHSVHFPEYNLITLLKLLYYPIFHLQHRQLRFLMKVTEYN